MPCLKFGPQPGEPRSLISCRSFYNSATDVDRCMALERAGSVLGRPCPATATPQKAETGDWELGPFKRAS